MRSITVDILPQKKAKHRRRWYKSWWVRTPVLIIVILIAIMAGIGYWKVMPMVDSSKEVMAEVAVLKQAAKDQNLTTIKTSLPILQDKLDTLDTQVEWFAFAANIPWLGNYYNDSQHIFAAAKEGLIGGQILVAGAEPYADVLGFKSGTTASQTKPAEDRVAELTLLMPSLLPSLDQAQGHFDQLKAEMDQVDPHRYPGKVGNVDIRKSLTEVKGQVNGLEAGMQQARPLLTVLPSVMGAPDTKTYLLIFQNDKELRPTGGFMTSVAYVTFSKGQFTVHDQGDIYSIDKNKAYKAIPTPIKKYLNVPQWNMRDTNFSPDFVQSMADFEYYYQKMGDRPIDGIIALDTQFVEGLMQVTGPISVKGYKQPFSAQPINVNGTKVPQVVYQLELVAEKSGGGSDRKDIIGDLMQEIIKKVLTEPPTKWPSYLAMLQQQGQEKNILMYFHDTKAQQLAEDNNFAGRIVDAKEGQDYLHINDANLAGLKSNFYLTQAAKRDITIDGDGTVHEKLSITYKNTGKFDGWINATARNYTRVYVPKGSKLVKSSGGDQKVTTSSDLDKTVFDNFVTVKPLQSRVVTFEYTLPFKISNGNYSSLIQKQPGAQNWTYMVAVNGQSQTVLIDGDKTITADF